MFREEIEGDCINWRLTDPDEILPDIEEAIAQGRVTPEHILEISGWHLFPDAMSQLRWMRRLHVEGIIPRVPV